MKKFEKAGIKSLEELYEMDVDDLAKQMERYYQDRELLAKHGENAEIWARRNVTMKKLQWKWIDLMKEVLNT